MTSFRSLVIETMITMERKSHISESELMDFFNDSLSVEEKQVILDWKELSEENRRLFEKVRKENLLLKEVVRAKLLRGDYSAIRARIGRRRRRVVRWTYRVAAIAAVAVIAVMLYVGPLWRHTVDKEPKTLARIGPPARTAILELSNGERHYLEGGEILFTEEEGFRRAVNSGKVVYDKKQDTDRLPGEKSFVYHKITVPRGAGIYHVRLHDGSVIWLNSDSRLEYPEKFAREERRVRIVGEAFFKVIRDTARPFVVETAGQAVTVLGTEFNVNAYPSEPVATTLVSGRVKVTSAKSSYAVVLDPGERSVLGEDGRLAVCPVKISDVISWKDGMISIENMSLREILKIVSRAYNVDFDLKAGAMGDMVLQGSISSDENLEVFLRVLGKVADVEFQMKTDGRIEVSQNK